MLSKQQDALRGSEEVKICRIKSVIVRPTHFDEGHLDSDWTGVTLFFFFCISKIMNTLQVK